MKRGDNVLPKPDVISRPRPQRDDQLAGAPHLRFDRQDNGIEIGPLAPFPHLQRRGDLCPAQLDFDPIGRDGDPIVIGLSVSAPVRLAAERKKGVLPASRIPAASR